MEHNYGCCISKPEQAIEAIRRDNWEGSLEERHTDVTSNLTKGRGWESDSSTYTGAGDKSAVSNTEWRG